jgi:hypothetical protein
MQHYSLFLLLMQPSPPCANLPNMLHSRITIVVDIEHQIIYAYYLKYKIKCGFREHIEPCCHLMVLFPDPNPD